MEIAFISSDFLSHTFIILVLAGAFTLLLLGVKKDIELTIGKKKIQELGWGWAIGLWIVFGVIMEGIWYFVMNSIVS